MRLQLALDDVSLENGLKLLAQVRPYIDIVEVGTPMIIEYGMEAVRQIRENFPDLTITADAKIMDAGVYEASQCFRAGANIVTVMGCTHDETIVGAITAAKEYNGEVMADLMTIQDLANRSKELVDMGIDYCCVHASVDRQAVGENPYIALDTIANAVPSSACCVAGGVNVSSLPIISKMNPEIVIVGGAITHASTPSDVAQQLRNAIQEHTKTEKS